MMLPIGDEASKQAWTPQQWTVCRGDTANGDVISSPRAGMLAIEIKFLRAQPAQPRLFEKNVIGSNQFLPTRGRVDVYFQNAGVGGKRKFCETVIMRGFV